MPTLALDTTTREGSVALVVEGRVVAERPGDAGRSHGERLPGELTRLLDDCGVALADVDLFAVASGPGSFTGLRIGIATVQGLAFVMRRLVVAISAIEALAHTAAADLEPGALVGVWMDAHRGDVFSGLYRVTTAPPFTPERVIEVEQAGVGAPGEAVRRWSAAAAGEPLCLTGDGAVQYRDAWALVGPRVPRIMSPPLLAGAIGRLAGVRAVRGEAVPPAAVRPFYVRRPDAVIARDRRQ